ncbi:MAG: hypothetical protein H6737_13475 [Alphaproteobacteria bacterium]|nr:hypothetical protein [Alphaproteobacteria bacterium]
MRWRASGLVVAAACAGVAALHAFRGTPASPPHRYVLDRPLVAIVGGRAEDCLPRAWGDLPEDRVVSLARRDTDWRAVVAQIRFALDAAPPGILVAAVDPEQLLWARDATPDPDRLRRGPFAMGGVPARIYGVFDRWLSVPRLFERAPPRRYDAHAWGAEMGRHWADPDGLAAVRRALREARDRGVEVVPVVLPMPEAAVDAWRSAERGAELDRILESLGATDLSAMQSAYFPDGLACSRVTGRAVLEQLAR